MNNVYVYDQELSGKKYQKLLEQLETRLTDLGISGKIYRLGPMTRLEDMARDELAKRPKTIVAVGGDGLISCLAGLMAKSKIPLGVVPIGKSMIAEGFGITIENACRTLAARRIITLDLGKIDNKHTFVCRAMVSAADPSLTLDEELSVNVEGRVSVEAVNVIGDDFGYVGARPQADDGRLNVYILKTEAGLLRKDISQSAFICRRLEFLRGALKVELDGAVEVSGVREITISPAVLQVIVGKDRTF